MKLPDSILEKLDPHVVRHPWLYATVILAVVLIMIFAPKPMALYLTHHGLCSHPYESLCHRQAPHKAP